MPNDDDTRSGGSQLEAAQADIIGGEVERQPSLSRGALRAKRLVLSAVGRTRRLVNRLPIEAGAEAALARITDPRFAALLQRGLTSFGNTGLDLSFKRQPGAGLLFEFADWCGEQAGRDKVMALVLQDALSPRGGFNQLAAPFLTLGASGDPLGHFAAMPRSNDMRRRLTAAHHGMMRTLCAMAEISTDSPPASPYASPQVLADHFRASGVPARFERLAGLAMGSSEDEAGDASAYSKVPTTDKSALTRVKTLLPARTSLSPAHRFLLGSYLTFLQAYLVRNMVDALPSIMESIRTETKAESGEPPPGPDILKE